MIYRQNANDTTYPAGRYRLFKIRNVQVSSGTTVFDSVIFMKTYTNSRQCFYRVSYVFMGGEANSPFTKCNCYLDVKYVKAYSTLTNSSSKIVSFELAYDSNGYVYLCATTTGGWGGDLTVYPDVNLPNSLTSGLLAYEGPNTTDTVLISKNIEEGLWL